MPKDTVVVCPRCGSTDIKYYDTHEEKGNLVFKSSSVLNPSTYFCQNCNYRSSVFPEIDINEAKKIKVNKNIEPYVVQKKEYPIPLWWKILMMLVLFLMAFIAVSYFYKLKLLLS